MNYQNLKNDLDILENKIKEESKSEYSDIFMRDYLCLSHFMKNNFPKEDADRNPHYQISSANLSIKVYEEFNTFVSSFFHSVYELEEAYRNILSSIDLLKPVHKFRLLTHFSTQKTSHFYQEFFHLLGEDVYQVYSKIMKHENVLIKKQSLVQGSHKYFYGLDNSIICLSSKIFKTRIEVFAHEMGHAYQAHLLKDSPFLCEYNFFAEFFSTLFEMLFLDYLKEYTSYQKEAQKLCLCNFDYYFSQILIAGAQTRVLKKDFKEIDSNLRIVDVSDDEVKKYINMHNRKLVCNQDPLWIYSQFYAVGFLLSLYFRNQMKQDFKSGLTEAKEFIQASKYLDFSEIIEKYMSDSSLVESYIKESTEKTKVKRKEL